MPLCIKIVFRSLIINFKSELSISLIVLIHAHTYIHTYREVSLSAPSFSSPYRGNLRNSGDGQGMETTERGYIFN